MARKNLSANTLFHYTTSLSNITGILRNGFQPRFCLESYDNLIDGPNEIAFPMVCFCDITISQVANHTIQYGSYALCLSKEWGMRNSITPVVYTYPNSSTATFLTAIRENLFIYFDIDRNHKSYKAFQEENELYKEFMLSVKSPYERDEKKKQKSKALQNAYKGFANFVRHIKPYEGRLFRREQGYIDSVRFYDEREWRYVPNTNDIWKAQLKDSYNPELFKRKGFNRLMAKKLRKLPALMFGPEDIRFIIVKNESEISELIGILDHDFQKQFSYYDLKVLFSRIISLEQILDDF